MECWKREDYVNKMEDHLLNTSAGNSIFGLINKGERINDKNKGEDDGNEYKQELFPMIKELYTNCQRTSLENATEFLKMQNDVSKNISLADATKHFDFAVASMNKVWFRADQLKIYSWQECSYRFRGCSCRSQFRLKYRLIYRSAVLKWYLNKKLWIRILN